jgi:hypothetical protein
MHESITAKSRRYEGDKLDFIIPFLIHNQISDRLPQKDETPLKPK